MMPLCPPRSRKRYAPEVVASMAWRYTVQRPPSRQTYFLNRRSFKIYLRDMTPFHSYVSVKSWILSLLDFTRLCAAHSAFSPLTLEPPTSDLESAQLLASSPQQFCQSSEGLSGPTDPIQNLGSLWRTFPPFAAASLWSALQCLIRMKRVV